MQSYIVPVMLILELPSCCPLGHYWWALGSRQVCCFGVEVWGAEGGPSSGLVWVLGQATSASHGGWCVCVGGCRKFGGVRPREMSAGVGIELSSVMSWAKAGGCQGCWAGLLPSRLSNGWA